MTAQPSLFDEPARTIWRKPDAREHACDVCGNACGFGLGPPILAKQKWFCGPCRPPEWWGR